MMTTVGQILRSKPQVYAVSPDQTVYDALRLMAEKNIGAVLVIEDGDIRGIFSERDYARRGILRGHHSRETAVREMMTPEVIFVEPGDTVETCMALMTEKRIRHLPVVSSGRLIGVVSIGDIVRAVVDEQQFTIQSLVRYVAS
jgi:CBS domain-containing protein